MKTILFLLLAVFTFAACEDDGTKDQNAITPPTSAEYKQSCENNLAEIIQTKKFKVAEGLDFTSEKGVNVKIAANSLYLAGLLVEGEVTFKFVELYKRGEMLSVNRPLMGTDVDGNKGPMTTGGQFYIEISQNGNIVDGNYTIDVPAENTGDLNTDMSFWVGDVDDSGDILWEEEETGKQAAGGIRGNTEMNNYNVWGKYFGWINIDILSSLPGEKTPILVSVPDGFDNKNSSVYVAYKGKPGTLAYLDVYDTENKLFTEHYGLGPIGLNFYVIFTTIIDDKFIYAIKDVTLEKDKIIKIESGELQSKTKEELIALINELE